MNLTWNTRKQKLPKVYRYPQSHSGLPSSVTREDTTTNHEDQTMPISNVFSVAHGLSFQSYWSNSIICVQTFNTGDHLLTVIATDSSQINSINDAKPEISVSHWPFSNQFSQFARPNLLYISNGEAIDSLSWEKVLMVPFTVITS